jgi:transposase-like protein
VGKRTRRKFTDAVKINAVRRVTAGSTVAKEAERLGVVGTVVRRWVIDPRYQSPGDTLPTKAAATKRRRAGKPTPTEAKPIIVTAQQCPHCGGALEVKAA